MNQIDIETMSDSKSKLTAHSEASLPRPSAWPIPLVLSQTADSKESPNIGFNVRVEKIGGRVNLIGKQPTSCQVRSSLGRTHVIQWIFYLPIQQAVNLAQSSMHLSTKFYLTVALQMSPILYVLQGRDQEIIRFLT